MGNLRADLGPIPFSVEALEAGLVAGSSPVNADALIGLRVLEADGHGDREDEAVRPEVVHRRQHLRLRGDWLRRLRDRDRNVLGERAGRNHQRRGAGPHGSPLGADTGPRLLDASGQGSRRGNDRQPPSLDPNPSCPNAHDRLSRCPLHRCEGVLRIRNRHAGRDSRDRGGLGRERAASGTAAGLGAPHLASIPSPSSADADAPLPSRAACYARS
jgi:hypothetical protein